MPFYYFAQGGTPTISISRRERLEFDNMKDARAASERSLREIAAGC